LKIELGDRCAIGQHFCRQPSPRKPALIGGSFKRVPSGFVVAGPTLWPLASAQHYVATEAQQVEIEARLTKTYRGCGAIAFLLVAIAFIVAEERCVAKVWRRERAAACPLMLVASTAAAHVAFKVDGSSGFSPPPHAGLAPLPEVSP